jgi:hypothetical protein
VPIDRSGVHIPVNLTQSEEESTTPFLSLLTPAQPPTSTDGISGQTVRTFQKSSNLNAGQVTAPPLTISVYPEQPKEKLKKEKQPRI